mgnify:CR=1 FL=1
MKTWIARAADAKESLAPRAKRNWKTGKAAMTTWTVFLEIAIFHLFVVSKAEELTSTPAAAELTRAPAAVYYTQRPLPPISDVVLSCH